MKLDLCRIMMIRNCVTCYRCRRILRAHVPITSVKRGGTHLTRFKGAQTSRRWSVSSTAPALRSGPIGVRGIFRQIREAPLQYFTIPAVAAFLGLYTNWMGVKMLFYPIEYTGECNIHLLVAERCHLTRFFLGISRLANSRY